MTIDFTTNYSAETITSVVKKTKDFNEQYFKGETNNKPVVYFG